MRIRILPATVGGTPGNALTGLVIDDRLAIDAGPLGFWGTAEEQARIRDVLLTHAHIDHIAGLPVFLDNVYGIQPGCPTVYALKSTLETLRNDVFNDRLMPDFYGLSKTLPPFLVEREVVPDVPIMVAGYTINAFRVEHNVPTVGYLVDDGRTVIAMITDTLPIPQIFTQLAKIPGVKAVFLECSFPNRMARLAEVSKHLTVSDFAELVCMLPENVTVYPIHVKPRYHDEVVTEVKRLNLANVKLTPPGTQIEL